MKALKLILTTLLFLVSFAAEAQNVVIYKDGNIVREYTAEQVDSVVYVPAKEVKYYYYVGWEEVNESNLATKGTELIEFETKASGQKLSSSLSLDNGGVRATAYYVLPENVDLYDDTANSSVLETYIKGPSFTLNNVVYNVYTADNKKIIEKIYLIKK